MCGGLSSGRLVAACLFVGRLGNMTVKPDWVPDPRPVVEELEPGYDHADYTPTVISQMEGFTLMGRLQAATKELWLTMAKATR